MSSLTSRSLIFTTAAALSLGTAIAPASAAPLPGARTVDIQLTAEQMVLDLVRHGQSTDNVEGIIGTTPPGAPLTAVGEQQADAVAPVIAGEFPAGSIDGVYASEFVRAQDTAAPLAQLLGLDVQVLPGLNELNAGILNDAEQTDINGLLYLAAPIMWMFGQYWVPQLGSTIDPNGMAFNDRFTDAVETIYDNGGTTTDGQLHDVAFSHAAAIATWVMMNVKNPDFELFFSQLTQGILPNTGQVVIEGSPEDGWTLVSWNGEDVPEDPGLLTGLFVDFRDLIVAPQMALWHIWEAIQGGDWDEVSAAVQTGFTDVFDAMTQFPQAVLDTITGAADHASDAAATITTSVADLGDALAG